MMSAFNLHPKGSLHPKIASALKPQWPELKVQDVFSMHPKVQHVIASALAANIGHELAPVTVSDLDEKGNEATIHAWQDDAARRGNAGKSGNEEARLRLAIAKIQNRLIGLPLPELAALELRAIIGDALGGGEA